MLNRRNFITSTVAVALCPATFALAQESKVSVVATFSILGDFVREVGGDRIDLSVLVGPGSDAHVYAPAPGDAKKLAAARLVVQNGLGFEGWIGRLIKASNTKARIVVATRGVKAIKAPHGHGHGHGHHHDENDPHAWQNVANAKIYVTNIRDGLIAVDPAGKETYSTNAAAYIAKLDALEKHVRDAVAKIPAGNRKVITNHDAFAYFGTAYGLHFIAPQGISTDAAPSAQSVARIIRQIRQEKIPAVFVENVADTRLAERIAKESGAKLGGVLYSDQLSPAGGPAGTYIDMVRHNIRELTAALGG
ncbi:MAG: metal ABC transporter substrate-binding protein [Beijerinckiaceae bacterium]|nr:metal ABC transporter substrate-binding protein [Beijerinckiaceae bacterium]